MNAPICLIQWLPPGEKRETVSVIARFHSEVDIYHADVSSKSEAERAITAVLAAGLRSVRTCWEWQGRTRYNNWSRSLSGRDDRGRAFSFRWWEARSFSP